MRALISLLLSLPCASCQANSKSNKDCANQLSYTLWLLLGVCFLEKYMLAKSRFWSLQSKRDWLLPSLPRLPEEHRAMGNWVVWDTPGHLKLGHLKPFSVHALGGKGFTYSIVYTYLFGCMCVHKCQGQRATQGTRFSPPTWWLLRD